MVIFPWISCVGIQFGFPYKKRVYNLKQLLKNLSLSLISPDSPWYLRSYTHTDMLCHYPHFQARLKLRPIPCALSPGWYCCPQGSGCHPGSPPQPQTQLQLWARTFCYSIPWWCTFPSFLCVCLSACPPSVSLCSWCVLQLVCVAAAARAGCTIRGADGAAEAR